MLGLLSACRAIAGGLALRLHIVLALRLLLALRLFGLLGREEDRYIPWEAVRRFGPDIILVEEEPRPRLSQSRRRRER